MCLRHGEIFAASSCTVHTARERRWCQLFQLITASFGGAAASIRTNGSSDSSTAIGGVTAMTCVVAADAAVTITLCSSASAASCDIPRLRIRIFPTKEGGLASATRG